MQQQLSLNYLGTATPEYYQNQLDDKVVTTQSEFKQFGINHIEVFPSPPDHFRMRAEFKIWHERDSVHFAMYQPGKYKQATRIDEFSIGSHRICQLMPALLTELNINKALRKKLFQTEFLTTTTGDALITLIYHRQLDNEWHQLASKLEMTLNAKIIGRSRKQKIVVSEDFVEESFAVNNRLFRYRQHESSFTQPNGHVCQQMLNWAFDVSQNLGGDLIELYCGNGNFTLPLSKNFRQVIATEIAKSAIRSAQHNIAVNQCSNIKIIRMSSEEFGQALNGVRPFRRLADINLADYQFSALFVDPPRAGLDDYTLELASQFNNIIYISCNPETLRNNLVALSATHKINRFALFDQFPYTHHRECGIWLSKL